jgi:hypothetical protein
MFVANNDLNFVYNEEEEVRYHLMVREENEDGQNWKINAKHDKLFSDYKGSILFTSDYSFKREQQLLLMFIKELEDIIWNGEKWRGGTGLNFSPGINDTQRNVYIMPGSQGSILENSNCKNLKLFEGANLKVLNGVQLKMND